MKKALLYSGLSIVVFYLIVVFCYAAVSSKTPIEKPLAQEAVSNEQITPDGLYIEINKVRAENSLIQYKRNALLDKSAGLKCADMAKNHYYSHKDPSGKSGYMFVNDVGLKYGYVAEDLNSGYFKTNKEAIQSWMDSPPHKASIVDPRYTEIGFATCRDDKVPEDTIIVLHEIEPYVEPQVQYVPQQSQPSYTSCSSYEMFGTVNTNCRSY